MLFGLLACSGVESLKDPSGVLVLGEPDPCNICE